MYNTWKRITELYRFRLTQSTDKPDGIEQLRRPFNEADAQIIGSGA